MFYTLLQATTAAEGGSGSALMQFLPFILILVVFYFFMIRPQQKRQKEINNFRKGLQPGQEVVTSGGIYGKIKEINDNIVVLEIAHNVCIKVDKSTIFANPTAAQ